MIAYDGGRFHLYLEHGYRGAGSGALLMESVRLFCGSIGLPCPGEETLTKTSGGKPYFDAPGAPRFSVSHSGELWACAISRDRIGFDVECRKARDWRSIAERFFHPAERDLALAGGEGAFFLLWTAKESYVKYLGVGIDESFSTFCLARGDAVTGDALGVAFAWPPVPEGYYACVCTPAEQAAILNVYQNMSTARPQS
ncbi:MAG TPA: 4'-phosphopantetheinyl transferase superfamily protein [Clostridia bacterium]|nr:4'-phosphopantetheinyl transferase superfamily protein [Clostridia bacterium]